MTVFIKNTVCYNSCKSIYFKRFRKAKNDKKIKALHIYNKVLLKQDKIQLIILKIRKSVFNFFSV